MYIISKRKDIRVNLSPEFADLFGFETQTFILNTINCCSNEISDNAHIFFTRINRAHGYY